MGDVSTYAADQVSILLAGFDLTKGIAEGTFVTVERVSDTFSDKVGSGGEVVVSKSLDRRAEVMLKLLQSSTANTVLSGLLAMAEQGTPAIPGVSPGKGPWEFTLVDRFSGATFHADRAWIVKPAKAEYGNEATNRDWKIRVASLDLMPVAGAVENFGTPPPWFQTVLPSVTTAILRALGRG